MFTVKHNKPLLSINPINVIVKEQDIVTFLGVVIDKKLNWNAHIAHICSKISKSKSIMRILKFIFL